MSLTPAARAIRLRPWTSPNDAADLAECVDCGLVVMVGEECPRCVAEDAESERRFEADRDERSER